jgi:hypothetical protein
MTEHNVTLPSGRNISAEFGIIGIDGGHNIYQGYDGYIDVSLTQAECVELADIMLQRWQAFKDKHSPT